MGGDMSLKPKDQPLNCEVEKDHLVIRIGIGTVAWAAKKRNGGPLPNNYRVIDQREWANDVSRAIQKEDEIGDSMLSQMLDRAMQMAADNGSIGLSYPK